ncbi:MAG: hypothetical protein LUE86_01115 [Clostridiales bacterium]|nr:hypothetical protein [Clostridiales bacterium]
MGIYAGYLGEMSVPEGKREEFSRRVLEILRQGGMMRLETRQVAGRRLQVLEQPEEDRDGSVAFDYSYFGDCRWERAEYRPREAAFHTQDVGSYEFQWVTSAVYILYELYSEKFGMAEVDGELFDAVPYIAWLNRLFGENYTNIRAADPWRIYQLLHECGYADESESVRAIRSLYEPGGGKIFELAEYLYVSGGPDAFQRYLEDGDAAEIPVDENRISLAQIIFQAEPTVRKLRESSQKPKEELLEDLRRILLTDPELGREMDYDPVYSGFVVLLKLLSARIMAKAIAVVFDLDFWTFWDSVSDSRWDGSVWAEKSELSLEPIEPMTTAEFVDVSDEEVCFCRVEREAGEKNFHVSDDDRALFWKRGGDVCFSDAMKQWLSDRKTEYAAILAGDWDLLPAEDCLAQLADLLTEADSFYKRIYAFGGMLRDFEAHADSREYQAAVRLLAALAEQNRIRGAVIGDTVYNWEQADRNLTFNEGRLAMRRCLAVLANQELRMELLGF